MSTQDIVQKLWNLCNVLRDDGITYHQYVTELTYILFLKMADETGADKDIPEAYRWCSLTSRSGIDLKKHYYTLLSKLGEESVGRVAQIYANASSSIEEPKNLEKIITEIDKLDWYEAKEEGLGDLYEGLLEKNANEKKSGAGQYFTPRVLIDVMTELIKPQLGDKCFDPACGTFGFMIAANRYVNAHNDMILFRIANYFLRFSSEYKRFHNIDVLPNDWYEYVEYGTTNPLTIFLQRNGFSREASTYIKQHLEYITEVNGEYKVKTELLDCPSKSVCKEAAEIKYNIPELFFEA